MSARGRPALAVSASLAIALGCTPGHAPARPPAAVVSGPTTSWLEAERIADDDRWSCVGVLDVDRDAGDEIVLVASGRIRAIDPGGASTDTAITEPLHGPPLGCDAGDLDGDGDLDLLLADERRVLAALSDGGGWTFSDPIELPTAEAAATFALALFDGDGDGALDAYVGRSIQDSSATFVVHGCRTLADGDFYCGDPARDYLGAPNVVLRGLGGGAFAIEPGTGAEDPFQTQAVAALDVDGDGRQDLVAANDAMPNRVYLSRGGLRFEDATELLGLERRNHGMSVLSGDLDRDGAADLAFADIGPPLVLRRAGARFEALTAERGFAPVAQFSWGSLMEDLDGDRDLDLLFMNRGEELQQLSLWCADDCGLDDWPNEELLLWRNDGSARFSAESPGLSGAWPLASGRPYAGGRALAHGDVDRDGVLDVVVVRSSDDGGSEGRDREAWLLRGRSSAGRGISVEAPQGAIVTACVAAACESREVIGGGGFGSLAARRTFFGIGSAPSAAVTVAVGADRRDLGEVAAGALARDPRAPH